MVINDKLPKIWYGGDYNPEQWGPDIWKEDERMFKLAGIDVATVNVFFLGAEPTERGNV
ncbi:hypothetical protein HMSSN139_55010 [Paenibacillus sp. HMSSN-139]|nr:hypothetical protein HMSSN139_55010 [Paenibacillus sp. HMSSN-139]